MFNRKNLISFIYLIAFIFLIYSSVQYWIIKDYWQLFINFEFIIILIYMNFIYRKYPLKLTQSFVYIGLIHFVGYGINAYFIQNMFKLGLSILIIIGIILYLIRLRKTKVPIYFNYKVKWPFFLGICFERYWFIH